MIQATRHGGPGLGLILDTYNEFMTPMRSPGAPANLGYTTIDTNPLQGISSGTGIAVALGGLALGVGSGLMLWKRRKVGSAIRGALGLGRARRRRRRR